MKKFFVITSILDMISQVEIVQEFVNESQDTIEAQYVPF